MTSTNPQSAATRQVNPTEVGWQFVPQYYTFVNKQPNRLHCFYTKNSTFTHGIEGEDTKSCYGQQEIHTKIMALNYENCKVFIHSVDAQSSAGGGILIQVVGEMSNRDEAWKKFVQTFFLAEQPNGYFVLNDIFRYLKEESADEAEEEEDEEAAGEEEQHEPVQDVSQEVAAPVPVSVSVPVDQISSFKPEETAPPPAASPAPVVPIVEESAPEPIGPESSEAPQVNGVNGHSELAESEGAQEPEPTPVPQAEPEPATTIPEPTPAPEVPPPVKVPSPAPPAPVAPVETPQKSPAPTPAPQPPAPSGPRTWATLAASNNKKWGNVASDAKGVSAAAPQTPPPAPSPRPTSSGTRTQEPPSAQAITTAQCFVKGVTENVTEATVREVLTARFGPIKDLEIVRNKACAFLEFTTVEAARKAIQASLPQHAGGEGGIRLDIKGGPGARLTVERRKERDERPAPRARGGAPSFGEGRGGANAAQAGEGRGGAQGGRGRGGTRGRGGPPKS